MGRCVKRLPLDFDWPLGQVWKGYVSPYRSVPCYGCAEEDKNGSYGYSKEAQKISKQWYEFDNPRYVELGNGRTFNDNALCHHLDQDDVDELAEHGRLTEFTHTWSSNTGLIAKKPAYRPTADEVNEWSKRGLGHDAINKDVVVEFRCKKAGVSHVCGVCGGSGELWQSPQIEKAANEWQDIEPPEGDGWQLWETVSEGSPISPVFATGKELVDYMVKNDGWNHKWSRSQAEAMVKEGYAPSAILVDGKVLAAPEAAEYLSKHKVGDSSAKD